MKWLIVSETPPDGFFEVIGDETGVSYGRFPTVEAALEAHPGARKSIWVERFQSLRGRLDEAEASIASYRDDITPEILSELAALREGKNTP